VRPAFVVVVESRDTLMVTLAKQMLTLHQQAAAAKTPDAQARLWRQIDATDRQIDRLVYELYGLTEEEIKIVEEGTGK
jgi:hypothetical protein